MEDYQKSGTPMNAGLNKMLLDLLFNLAAGESVNPNWSYEEQLEHYRKLILPHYGVEEIANYGQKCRLISKYMFPNKPENIKKRRFLIKTFASYIVLKELAECNDYSLASSTNEMILHVIAKIRLGSENDQNTFAKECRYLITQYTESLSKDDYNNYIAAMTSISEDFERAYNKILESVMGDAAAGAKSAFAILMDTYHIPQCNAIMFNLEVDAIAETVVIKNEHLEYIDEFKAEWEKHFPKYKFGKELEDYIKAQKQPYVVTYGNNISSIRNDKFLFIMLADVTVKLALVDGARNLHDLTQKIKELTRELGNNIKDAFIGSRENVIRGYHLTHREDYPSDLANVLIPYRTDLFYLRDIIIEEISFRNAENIVKKQSKCTKDASEYKLMLSQKDAEIYDLKRELEYYENLEQQEFKAEVSQYNKALTDLFRKICDLKYNSPLNELYLLANGTKELKVEELRGILQNLIFILSTINIIPYDTGNVGKKVHFYDDEANIIYAVDDNKVKKGLNQGIQVYPGWKYKDSELVLPKVDIKEE